MELKQAKLQLNVKRFIRTRPKQKKDLPKLSWFIFTQSYPQATDNWIKQIQALHTVQACWGCQLSLTPLLLHLSSVPTCHILSLVLINPPLSDRPFDWGGD